MCISDIAGRRSSWLVVAVVLAYLAPKSSYGQSISVANDKSFGNDGFLTVSIPGFGPATWQLKATADGRLTLFSQQLKSSTNWSEPQPPPRVGAVGSFEFDGSPRLGFGNGGIVSAFPQPKCGGPAAFDATAKGDIALAVEGFWGSHCFAKSRVGVTWVTNRQISEGSNMAAPSIDASGGALPGVVTSHDNDRVLTGFFQESIAGSGVSESGVLFGFSESSSFTESYRWKLPANATFASIAPKIILQKIQGGDFYAVAFVPGTPLQIVRLGPDGAPSQSASVQSRNGFLFRYPLAAGSQSASALPGVPTGLLGANVSHDGTLRVAVTTAEGIDVASIAPDGTWSGHRVTNVTGAQESGRAWLGDFNASGVLTLARPSADQSRVEFIVFDPTSGIRPAIRHYAWGQPEGLSLINIYGLAARANSYESVLSIRAGESGGAVASALVKFDFAKTARAESIVEFYNTDLKHYFITSGNVEPRAILDGKAGPGWSLTDQGFQAYASRQSAPSNAEAVCRFYGTPGKGPNSHFYTFEGSECEAVKKDAGWTYEGIAFYSVRPTTSGCHAGYEPVYRAYNNRFTQNDSNHRYSTSLASLQSMSGWSVEGVVFCSPAVQ